MTVGIYNYPDTSGHSDAANASDKGRLLRSHRADADFRGFASYTNVADIDIVIASRETAAGITAQRDVVSAVGVINKRTHTSGRVLGSGRVAFECSQTGGRVVRAVRVEYERTNTGGRVPAAGCVAMERKITGGRVVEASRAAKESLTTGGRVAAAGCVAKERIKTDGRVVDAITECGVNLHAGERSIPLSSIVAGIASVRCW